MQWVGMKEGNGQWQWSNKGSGTTLTKQWTVTENQPGTYTFSGAVNGTDPTLTTANKVEAAKTTPKQITIVVAASSKTPTPNPSPNLDKVNLPMCSFQAAPGIYVKNDLCSWDERCNIASSKTCGKSCWGINNLTAGGGHVVSNTILGYAAGTRLCTTTTDPNQIKIPACPFSGNVGDVWVKPDFFGYSKWDQHACKVGTKCEKSSLGISLSIKGFGANATVGIKTKSDTPGAVYSYMQAKMFGIGKDTANPYEICIVKNSSSTSSSSLNSHQSNSPALGILTVSATKVQVGEPFTITVTGQDPDGMQWVGVREGQYGKYHWSDKGSGISLTKTWTFIKKKPGTYSFYGAVDGTDPTLQTDYKTEAVKTNPEKVTVVITNVSSGGNNSPVCPGPNPSPNPNPSPSPTPTPSPTPNPNPQPNPSPNPNPSPAGLIHLPQCHFPASTTPGIRQNAIWAKNASCNWSNKCPLGYQCNSSCGIAGFYHLDTSGNTVASLSLPSFANSFDLCLQGDPTDFSVAPNCPFPGNKGDVWVSPKPANGSLVDWSTRVKVGSDNQKSDNPFQQAVTTLQGIVDTAKQTGVSINLKDPGIAHLIDKSLENAGIELDINSFSDLTGLTKYLDQIGADLSKIKIPNASIDIQTHSQEPGRVDAGISNGGFPLKLPTPVAVCVVGGTGSNISSNLVVPGGSIAKPSVKTNAPHSVSANKAVLGGRLLSKGGDVSVLVGIEWGPTTQYGHQSTHDYRIVQTSIWGDWEVSINNLQPGTTYHYRAFAFNNAGRVYGQDMTFTTPGGSGSNEAGNNTGSNAGSSNVSSNNTGGTSEAGKTYTLSASKIGTGTGIVVSNGMKCGVEGLICGSRCSVSFPAGVKIDITAAPYQGSFFSGWSGACSGISNACTVTMDSNKSVVADFEKTGSIQGKADLVITNISMGPGQRVQYTIKNEGAAQTSEYAGNQFENRLLINNKIISNDDVTALAAGESRTVVVNPTYWPRAGEIWLNHQTCEAGKSYTVKVVADVLNQVSESNEDNNVKEVTLTCP